MTGGEYCTLLKESSRKAHQTLFDEYYTYVRTIAFNRLRSTGSSEDIEECISDIFAQVFFSFDEKYVSGDLKGYIGTVAKRVSIDRFRSLSRKAGRTVSLDDDDSPEIRSDEDLAARSENAELKRILTDCIKSLGEPDSTIVIQKFYYNKNSNQIADLLSMKPSTVRMRIKRSAGKLRDALAERGFGEGMI